MKEKILIYLLISLLVITAGMGNWYFWKKSIDKSKEVEELKEQIKKLESQIKSQESTLKEEEKVDEYAGWKTYTNTSIGYKLRYPADWFLKEIDTTSEITGSKVKYLTLTTPDKKYFLYFGIKKVSDSFDITDRTGVGAGSFKDIGTITILGTKVTITDLVYQNKVKEKFYPKPAGNIKSADGQYLFLAAFSYKGEGGYETYDLKNLDYVSIAEKILKSIETL